MVIGGVVRSRAIPLLTSQCAQAAHGPPRLDRDRRGLLAPSFSVPTASPRWSRRTLSLALMASARPLPGWSERRCCGRDAMPALLFTATALVSMRPGTAGGVSAGIIPTNGGAHCVFAAVPSNRFGDEVRHNLAAGYGRALAEVSPTLAAAVATSRLEGRLWAFTGRRGFLREAWGPGGRSSAMPATSRIR
jgi:hypothetical protein